MAFDSIHFIKQQEKHDYSRLDYAPMFRKKFQVGKAVGKATLSVCGLGYGYYYLNGEKVTPDLFTAPVSVMKKLFGTIPMM